MDYGQRPEKRSTPSASEVKSIGFALAKARLNLQEAESEWGSALWARAWAVV